MKKTGGLERPKPFLMTMMENIEDVSLPSSAGGGPTLTGMTNTPPAPHPDYDDD